MHSYVYGRLTRMSKDRRLMLKVSMPLLKPRPLLLLLPWCVSVCVCVYVCTHVCMCVHVHVFVCAYAHGISLWYCMERFNRKRSPRQNPSRTEIQVLSILELEFFGIRYRKICVFVGVDNYVSVFWRAAGRFSKGHFHDAPPNPRYPLPPHIYMYTRACTHILCPPPL